MPLAGANMRSSQMIRQSEYPLICWSRQIKSGEAHHAITSLKKRPFHFKKSDAPLIPAPLKDKKHYLIARKL
jgi:hypothetical protein